MRKQVAVEQKLMMMIRISHFLLLLGAEDNGKISWNLSSFDSLSSSQKY